MCCAHFITTMPTTTSTSIENKNENGTSKKQSKYREREQWANKREFILALLAYAVGLGNVWRFPYLCYKNGGGAFFIPYLIFLFGGAIPILFLEVGIGQYFRTGGITVWGEIAPLFQGIGLGTLTIAFIANIYYIVVIAWALLYFVNSLTPTLPWSTCDNVWNTARCWSLTSGLNATNGSVNSAVEFWENKILQMSSGIHDPNGIQWELATALLAIWVVCFFCIWKGVKSTGKAVYVTAIFPYVVITALLIRGITLEGAAEGLKFYLSPDLSRLSDSQVWMDAGTQVIYSYAISVGTMTALGSYNKFHNNFYRQLCFLACMNSGTSFVAGIAIFSVLGYMAHAQHKTVGDVVASGPGLAFIAYPQAVSLMPWSSFWAAMFFTMILLLGLGSQFVCVEGFITATVDLFPHFLRRGKRREKFIFCVCLSSYVVGLSMVTRAGIYVFQLFDFYGASGMCLLWHCFFQAFVIGWIYGSERFYTNIEEMIGHRITPYFYYAWKYITPMVTAGLFGFYVITHKTVRLNATYEYPAWAVALGWMLAMASMVMLPLSMVIIWFRAPKGLSFQKKLKLLTTAKLPNHNRDQDDQVEGNNNNVEPENEQTHITHI